MKKSYFLVFSEEIIKLAQAWEPTKVVIDIAEHSLASQSKIKATITTAETTTTMQETFWSNWPRLWMTFTSCSVTISMFPRRVIYSMMECKILG